MATNKFWGFAKLSHNSMFLIKSPDSLIAVNVFGQFQLTVLKFRKTKGIAKLMWGRVEFS